MVSLINPETRLTNPMDYLVIFIGVVLIVAAIAIHFAIERRRFYRRNQSGIETFSSYSSSVFTRLLERILKIVSILMVLGGAFLCFIGFFGR